MNIRFNDIGIQHWAGAFILFLANTHDGIVRGDGAGNFNPDNTVTVGEFCAMAVRASEHDARINQSLPWERQMEQYINFVVGRGVRVYPGEFAPPFGELMQRQFAFNIAQRIIGVNAARRAAAALDRNGRAARWVNFHDRNQIINDTNVRTGVEQLFMNAAIEGRTGNTLAPRETLTRAEAAVIIARCLATDAQIEQFTEVIVMKKLVLDAGHFDSIQSNRTPNGVNGIWTEWAMNNIVCNHIVDMLQGYNVEISRVDDTTGLTNVSLRDRIDAINKTNPDLAISVHHNGAGNDSDMWRNDIVPGVEVIYHVHTPQPHNRPMAIRLSAEMSRLTGLNNRGGKSDFIMTSGGTLFLLRYKNADIPMVVTESGFMNHPGDYLVITSPEGQLAYARAIADECISFLGLQKI